jgi:acyl carrier protein phosphodiesterase
MNFLAHFHLAWPDEGLIAGGLEGDYVKGLLTGKLEPGIERGIKLHRSIDAHTDNHLVIVKLREEFPKSLRRYAGILIDISFDHYLTQHWARYSTLSLEDFTHEVYRALRAREEHLSEGSRAMLSRMLEYDILNRYHDWSAVTATATRVGMRFSRGNPLLEVERELEPVRTKLEQAFLEFYPQLVSFSQDQQTQMN